MRALSDDDKDSTSCPRKLLQFTHDLPCRIGKTALKYAIVFNKADLAAYLRSIGGPE
jgi:hypothetical protein